MNLLGRKDAWALSAIGAGAAVASPWLAGHPDLLPVSAIAPAIGSAWLSSHYARKRLDRVDFDSRDNFILPSDPVYEGLPPYGKLQIGVTRDRSEWLGVPDQFLCRHTAIIGQSGVGKTTLGEYLLWQQIVRGGGFIFIDAKLDAETRDKLAFMMRVAGRASEFQVLNVDDPANSNTYSPILEGDADEVSSRLLNLIPSSENSPGSDHFRQQAGYALTVLVGALKSAKRRYDMLDLSILLQSDRALESLLRLPMEDGPRRTLEIFLNQFRKPGKGGATIDVDKLKNLLGGLAGRISSFAQGKFGEVFNTYTPEIDLTRTVTRNMGLYVMLPTMGKDNSALSLGKMILSDLRTAVYRVQGLRKEERPNPPFMVFADEMGSYVMSGIARLFEQARSANIMIFPAFQTFANLRSISPDFEDIIIGNTWNKVFFKFASKDSPEIAAEVLGKTKRFIRSISVSENEGASANNLRATPDGSASKSGGYGESWRESEEFRASPDNLKSLGIGQAIVMSGSNLYHINTPMLNFGRNVPVFRVSRKRLKMPAGESGLSLRDRYKEFMMAAPGDSFMDTPEPGGLTA